MESVRLSGKVDTYFLHYTDTILNIGEYVSVVGELRTLNISGDRPVKCFVNVYQMNRIMYVPDEFTNDISVTNALVVSKKPLYSGKRGVAQSFDVSILRSHGRKSIVQCSTWHEVACAFAHTVNEGDKVNLWGRIQSSISSRGNMFITVNASKFEKIL